MQTAQSMTLENQDDSTNSDVDLQEEDLQHHTASQDAFEVHLLNSTKVSKKISSG